MNCSIIFDYLGIYFVCLLGIDFTQTIIAYCVSTFSEADVYIYIYMLPLLYFFVYVINCLIELILYVMSIVIYLYVRLV